LFISFFSNWQVRQLIFKLLSFNTAVIVADRSLLARMTNYEATIKRSRKIAYFIIEHFLKSRERLDRRELGS
jgi:hypothetical protein